MLSRVFWKAKKKLKPTDHAHTGNPSEEGSSRSLRCKRHLIRENEELKKQVASLSLENSCLRKLLDANAHALVPSTPLEMSSTDHEGPGHFTLLATMSYNSHHRSSASLPLKLDMESKSLRQRKKDQNAFRWAKVSDLDAVLEESIEEHMDDQPEVLDLDLRASSSITGAGELVKSPQSKDLLTSTNVVLLDANHCAFANPPNALDSENSPIARSWTNFAGALDLSALITRDSVYPVQGGGYADVYSGIMSRDEKTIKVAIKVLRAHTYTETTQWKMNKRLKREIRVWSCLQHPNIVPLLGTTQAYGPHSGMVCPWMSEGNLNDYLKERKPHLNLRRRLQILSDIVEGLVYCEILSRIFYEEYFSQKIPSVHTRPIVHGDLTTGNILMEDGKAHLSDFGLSSVMIDVRSNSLRSSTVGGAVRWAAPELYHFGTDLNAVQEIMKPCDVYSFGSVALQVISGKLPYDEIASEVQVLLELMKGVRPARPEEPLLTDAAWELITLCWTRDPYKRPSIEEVRRLLQTLRYDCSVVLLESTISS